MKRANFRIAIAMAWILIAAFFPTPSTAVQTSSAASDVEVPRYSPELDLLQQEMTENGTTNVGLASAEYITTPYGFDPSTSQTLFTTDRTHLWGIQFVQNDPRRDRRSFITYVVDQSDGGAFTNDSGNIVAPVPNSFTEPAIDEGMAKWQSDVNCVAPPIVKVADSGGNIDVVDDLVFRRPPGTSIADITHGGFLTSRFFDVLAPGGSQFILAVTFSWVFLDENGFPTDIDHNGRADVAFMEIYYNRGFAWSQPGNDFNIDIVYIATHESGHALGLNHFGRIFLTKNGIVDGITLDDVKFAPRAVMNALYVWPFSDPLTGSDKASFCHLWANAH